MDDPLTELIARCGDEALAVQTLFFLEDPVFATLCRRLTEMSPSEREALLDRLQNDVVTSRINVWPNSAANR